MNNFRMWAYALIATGLINWDYQRAQDNIAVKSLFIVVPGLVLLLITLNPRAAKSLNSPLSKYFWGAIGIAALAYAFIN
jgi:sulfite exporter TauE/SafE